LFLGFRSPAGLSEATEFGLITRTGDSKMLRLWPLLALSGVSAQKAALSHTVVYANRVQREHLGWLYDDAGQVIWKGDDIAGSAGRTQTNCYRHPDGAVAHLHYPGGAFIRHDYSAWAARRPAGMTMTIACG